jgi:hypothetical protein
MTATSDSVWRQYILRLRHDTQEVLDTRPDCGSTVKLLNKVYESMMVVPVWVVFQNAQND